MWHAVVLLVLCTATNILILQGVTTRLPYLGRWVVGAGLWAAVSQSRSLPDFSISLLGIVLAASFFFPGWKYHERGDKGRMASG